jgi:hypothetical protein
MLNKSALIKIKSIARNLSIVTCLYFVIFFPYFYASLFSAMVFDNPNMTVIGGLTIIGLFLAVPCSLLIAIFLMWRRFNQKQYAKAYFHCIAPFMVGFIAYGLIEIIGSFFFK